MSQSDIARFPHPQQPPRDDNNPDAAHEARKRISELQDAYVEHATPNKEELVGAIKPVSPATEIEPLKQPSHPQVEKQGAGAPVAPVSATTTAPTPMINTPLQAAPAAQAAPQPAQAHPAPHADAAKHSKLPSKLKPILSAIAVLALIFLIFKAPILFSQLNYATGENNTASVETNSVAVGPEPVINIPKINVSAPIVFADSNVEAEIQKDLESGVVHYANTAMPGEPGNAVIFGHSSNDWWEPGNYKFVFILLDKLVVGDTYTVNYNSKQYIYQVTETKVVEPTDLSVLRQTGEHEMTLITCTPPGTSWKRLVVHSKQISPVPTAAAESSADGQIQGSLPGNTPSLSERIGNWWKNLTTKDEF